ncbi:MAG TPA: histidine kinase dimerization/phospho-acceptor domain-containing protein [Candidatus Polarisedimenticolia bacterium]|nr:histidine kinase dimerization/phospho-acceptor domain-containing protein [Candidatus Polarisedimenticolia bacterium]
MVLRLVKNAGPQAPEGDSESRGTAAFLLVNGRGAVIEATGWEALSLEPVPTVIADPSDGDEPILAGIAGAVAGARRSRRPTLRLVEVPLERVHTFVIAAAPLPGPGRSGSIAVTIAETGPPEAGSAEGKVIRQLGHDLRTPLTSISGAIELLQSGRLGGLQEGQTKVVGLMQKGADALLRVIDQATAAYRGRRDLSELLGVGVEELVAGGLEEGAGAEDDLPEDDGPRSAGARPAGGRKGGARRKERGR